eukprot:1145179-Pelagomonas_calceolata.AAC.1
MSQLPWLPAGAWHIHTESLLGRLAQSSTFIFLVSACTFGHLPDATLHHRALLTARLHQEISAGLSFEGNRIAGLLTSALCPACHAKHIPFILLCRRLVHKMSAQAEKRQKKAGMLHGS